MKNALIQTAPTGSDDQDCQVPGVATSKAVSHGSARMRRPYTKPSLSLFGNVEEFTRGTGSARADARGGSRIRV